MWRVEFFKIGKRDVTFIRELRVMGNEEWGMGIQIDPEQTRGHANAQVMMPDIQA